MAALVSPANTTIYFGYGSNLWLHQMAQRCPESRYLGVARLDGYRWNISPRGYANVVDSSPEQLMSTAISDQVYEDYRKNVQVEYSSGPDFLQEQVNLEIESASTFVYGLVFSLTPTDEQRLDRNEDVPNSYTKEYLPTHFWPMEKNATEPQWTDVRQAYMNVTMLVYIDRQRTEDSNPKTEYIYRMNMGIIDAIALGIPEIYIDNVIRKFIPRDDSNGAIVAKVVEQRALTFDNSHQSSFGKN